MMEAGCGAEEIPSVDMDGVKGCKKCEEVIDCNVHGTGCVTTKPGMRGLP